MVVSITGERTDIDKQMSDSGIIDMPKQPTPEQEIELPSEIKNDVESRGLKDPIINADVYVTLNGSRSKLFIDPEVDLTTLQDDYKPKDWILDN